MLFERTIQNTEKNINDKFSIVELIEFERFCRDNAQWEEMKKCFSSNSTVTVSWFKGKGEEFVEASKKMNLKAPHKLYNTAVWVNNNKAVAITMATIESRTNINGCLLELHSDIKLLYCTQKLDGIWYISSMDGIYEKDLLIPCYPNSSITIPMEEISKYRSSYSNLSFVLSKEGYAINTELPGIDRPETVNKLYGEAEEWLSKE
jgi:hypothetical protein